MAETEITGTPKLNDSRIDLEYAAAKKEGRQPNCPFGGEPLEIRLREDGMTCWVWDENLEGFDKQGGSSNAPYCAYCLHSDWDFIDHDLVQW